MQIIELAAGGVPWKEHLYELEKQEGIEGAIKFCLYEVPPAPDLNRDLVLSFGVVHHCILLMMTQKQTRTDPHVSSCSAAGHEGEEVACAGGVSAAGVL